eukprot:TRINITY_DN4306_c0_g1_i1.p1 TRINITY_DN4306_c0_g1~~TRINITY_DN4306_c0_g1_i1.p1  ORF type:complete len:1230 (+),score=295.45 TRINITY_DN4306_c0_g1_i1:314-3691(+)
MKPSILNQGLKLSNIAVGSLIYGSVESENAAEYKISFGVEGLKGSVVKKKNVHLPLGLPMNFLVKEIGKNTNSIILSSLLSETTTTQVALNQDNLTRRNLSPGSLLMVQIIQITSSGLIVSLFDSLFGTIPVNQLEHPLETYTVDSSMQARVIYFHTYPSDSRIQIGLSARSVVIGLTPYQFPLLSAGDVLSATVSKIEKFGLVLSLNTIPQSKGLLRTGDSGSYSLGSEIHCKVAELNHFDGTVIVHKSERFEMDNSILKENNLAVGCVVECVVKKKAEGNILVKIKNPIHQLKGSIPLSELVDEGDSVEDAYKKIEGGDKINARIIATRTKGSSKFLPISHRSKMVEFEFLLTIKPSELNNPKSELQPRLSSLDDIVLDQLLTGYITSVSPSTINVSLSPFLSVAVHPLDASQDVKVLNNLQSHFVFGKKVQLKPVFDDTSSKITSFYLFNPKDKKVPNPNRIRVGKVVIGRIKKKDPFTMAVELGCSKIGFVHITDVDDDFKDFPLKDFNVNQYVQCYIFSETKKTFNLSLCRSRVEGVQFPNEKKALGEKTKEDLKVGDMVVAFFKEKTANGYNVLITRDLQGHFIVDETEFESKDLARLLRTKPGKVVRGVITEIKPKGPVQYELKMALVQKDNMTYKDFKIGDVLEGKIWKIRPESGLLISLDKTKSVNAFCPLHMIQNDTTLEEYPLRTRIECTVVGMSSKRKNLVVTIKLLDKVVGADQMDIDSTKDDSQDKSPKKIAPGTKIGDIVDDLSSDEQSQENTQEDVGEDDEEATKMEVNSFPVMESVPAFTFEGFQVKVDSPSSGKKEIEEDYEEEEATYEKKSKRAKKIEKRRSDKELDVIEEDLANEARAPETPEDFERLLLSSPNSSYIWIQYITHHLYNGEIYKARDIVERALKKINYREEREKMNVWVAYLNLENQFGSQESLMKVFQRALQANDPKQIHIHLFSIYQKSGNDQVVDDFFKTLLKKYRDSSKIYISYGLHKIQQKDEEGFRNLMQLSLKNLPKKKHVKIITKFAQFEFKHGSVERGRTIFDGIVGSFPKRLDLWSIYLDMEIKVGDPNAIRSLFDRVTSLNLSSKQMKSFLKKQLLFEKSVGNIEAIEAVKQKAIDFLKTKNMS